jgi:hypothetical protein
MGVFCGPVSFRDGRADPAGRGVGLARDSREQEGLKSAYGPDITRPIATLLSRDAMVVSCWSVADRLTRDEARVDRLVYNHPTDWIFLPIEPTITHYY